MFEIIIFHFLQYFFHQPNLHFIFQINRNNNNNLNTANHNHNNVHPTTSIVPLKPVITTLKPVEEAESPYMRMNPSMEDWPRTGTSPKQVPSPMQDDYMQMNGPPGTIYFFNKQICTYIYNYGNLALLILYFIKGLTI